MTEFTLTFEHKELLAQNLIELICKEHMRKAVELNGNHEPFSLNYEMRGHYVSDFIIDLHRFEAIEKFIQNYILIIRTSGIEFYEADNDRITYWSDDRSVLAIYDIDLYKLSTIDINHLPNYSSLSDEYDETYYCVKKINNINGE